MLDISAEFVGTHGIGRWLPLSNGVMIIAICNGLLNEIIACKQQDDMDIIPI